MPHTARPVDCRHGAAAGEAAQNRRARRQVRLAHPRRDWASQPPASAPGLGSHPPASAPGVGSPPPTSAPGLGSPLPASAPGLGSPPPTSAPGVGSHPPASAPGLLPEACHICTGSGLTSAHICTGTAAEARHICAGTRRTPTIRAVSLAGRYSAVVGDESAEHTEAVRPTAAARAQRRSAAPPRPSPVAQGHSLAAGDRLSHC